MNLSLSDVLETPAEYDFSLKDHLIILIVAKFWPFWVP